MNIFVISDIHGETRYIDMASEMIQDADYVAIVGDLSGIKDDDSGEMVLRAIEKCNTNILAVHGNWDRGNVSQLLEDKLYSLHSSGKVIEDIGFFGVGGANHTPMKTPVEYSEEEIYSFLESGYDKVKDAKTIVLLSHTPPKNTRDRTIFGIRGGSTSVRKFIEENRVDVCLTGHIHEAFGVTNIDNSIIANSGSFKKGKYSYVNFSENIELSQGRVSKKRRKNN